jgi:hypothetical protein
MVRRFSLRGLFYLLTMIAVLIALSRGVALAAPPYSGLCMAGIFCWLLVLAAIALKGH